MALTNTECFEPNGRCHIHGAYLEAQRSALAAQRSTHRAHVQALERRIAALESALAVAKATSEVKVIAFRREGQAPAVAPLVAPETSVTDEQHRDSGEHQALNTRVESAPLGPDPAQVWCDDADSFEERLAARAFFNQESVDEPARRWFLKTLDA